MSRDLHLRLLEKESALIERHQKLALEVTCSSAPSKEALDELARVRGGIEVLEDLLHELELERLGRQKKIEEIDLIVTDFLDRADDDWRAIAECSSGGQGLCQDASEDLHVYFYRHHGRGRTRTLWLEPSMIYTHYPPMEHHVDHCVLLVDGELVVDLTARQFGSDLLFPYYWFLGATRG